MRSSSAVCEKETSCRRSVRVHAPGVAGAGHRTSDGGDGASAVASAAADEVAADHHEATPLVSTSGGSGPHEILGANDSYGSAAGHADYVQVGTSQERQHRRRSSRSALLYDELKGMVALAAPVVGTYLLEMLPGIVSIVLVGHVKSDKTAEYLDATALAVAYSNLLGMSIGLGLATAMDTLCSQAYGANEAKRMGTYLQTGIIVLTVTIVIVAILFCRATDILIALGQPTEVAELAGTFTIYLLPGIPFLFVYELFRKVLQAQNIAAPMLYVALLANVLNVVVGFYLVYYTDQSWLGAAVARTICNISFTLFLFPYLAWSGLTTTFWDGLKPRAAIRELPQFLYLGVPGMLQMCFEWWAFEILALICGLLPNALDAIGANAIVLNISSLTYMFYLGMSIAGNVRIGNALGAGDPKRAAAAAKLTIGMAALSSLLCSACLIAFREQLPALFTHDASINDLAAVLVGICALYQIPDAVTCSIMGILRGIGWQSLGAWLNFAAYYCVGIPLGCVLAFSFGLGVEGLWLGMVSGLLLIAVSGTCIVSRCDWASLAEEAADRVNGLEFV